MTDYKEFIPLPTSYNSFENSLLVEDYPYGFTLRCQIRFWIEYKPRVGMRFVSCTLNPETGKWNKPKCSTYSLFAYMGKNIESGHISHLGESHDFVSFADFSAWAWPVATDNEKTNMINFIAYWRKASPVYIAEIMAKHPELKFIWE